VNPNENRAVKSYLRRLDLALRDVPATRRKEIVAEIEAHIGEELTQLPGDPTEAQVMDLLERIGEPEAIAADTREGSDAKPVRAGAMETITLILLLIGGLVLPIIGWIVGAILLWVSKVWTTRDKLIGTLIIPGGLALPFALAYLNTWAAVCVSEGGGSGGPSGPGSITFREYYDPRGIVAECTTTGGIPVWVYLVLMLLLALASIASTIYLARRLRSNASTMELAAIN
jgi:hypothetical protein